MGRVVRCDAVAQAPVMTSEPQPDLEAELFRAESELRHAWQAAIDGGPSKVRRLRRAVTRCRLARLKARGSWTFARRGADQT
jgi:hypothetical protein